LTEAGKALLEEERVITVVVNFWESMSALRTGVPRAPAACGGVRWQLMVRVWNMTYTDDGDIFDFSHVDGLFGFWT
jgi:hypothetical protein